MCYLSLVPFKPALISIHFINSCFYYQFRWLSLLKTCIRMLHTLFHSLLFDDYFNISCSKTLFMRWKILLTIFCNCFMIWITSCMYLRSWNPWYYSFLPSRLIFVVWQAFNCLRYPLLFFVMNLLYKDVRSIIFTCNSYQETAIVPQGWSITRAVESKRGLNT